ncbi:hypothetical protein [Roseisalinus antarcticus]|uniref:Uncharacterized protein n=1 Tax=Roseisalinus antarcticus TaxID=254357 RepID=A0A1Y5TZJ0_9RHOB|nr:hypothetical protein [Roseisalinus antarcticus]SLN75287.1 hypothetical protein ROA7023_03935 [Roseisalinus antarcticus]
MIVRFVLFPFALSLGLAAPAMAQVDVDALRAAISENNFTISLEQTLAEAPVVDLNGSGVSPLGIYIRNPEPLDDAGTWVLFTLRFGASTEAQPVPNALDSAGRETVQFILNVEAADSVYTNSALPVLRSGFPLESLTYALNCFEFRFPLLSPSSSTSSDISRWTFTPRDSAGNPGCGGNFGSDGGRWFTFTNGSAQIPLLAMGDEAELTSLLVQYDVAFSSDDDFETNADEQLQSGTETPETSHDVPSDTGTLEAETDPARVEDDTESNSQGAILEAEGARYAGIGVIGLTGRRIRQIAVLADDTTDVGVLLPLSQDEFRNGKPGYWETGIATGDYILRLPGGAAWSQVVVIPENGFVQCNRAAISPSADAFGANIGTAQCNTGRLPVTVAVDTGFVLEEDSHLTAGPCSGDEDLVDAGAPSNHYCASVEETDFRVSADDFGIELDDGEARERIDVLPGAMRNLAEAAQAFAEDRRVVNLTPEVKLKNLLVDITLVGDAVTTEPVSNGITVSSGNVGRVEDPQIISGDPPILRVRLEFVIAQNLQNALNTLNRNEVTIYASSVRDDLELLTGSGEKRERVPINIDLRSGAPRQGYNVLRVALPSARLPATVRLEGRLVGYDAPVRNYTCRVGLRIAGGSVYWLEAGAEQTTLPTEIAEEEFDLDQVIDILTGPIDNSTQDNTVNCLPEGTLITQIEVRDFPNEITVPFARPVLVYWLRTGTADNFYVSESIIPANEIYVSWMDKIYSELYGQRIFAIRKPVSGGGFETIQNPSSQTNPANMRMGVRQLVENQESEIFGDVDLRQVFLDAREQANELGLGDVSDIDVVVLSSESRRSRPLGRDGDCSNFAQESRELPYGARIVLLRDVRDGVSPLSADGPYIIDICSQSNGLGQSFSVVLVETKAVASENRSDLAEFVEALGFALDQLVE